MYNSKLSVDVSHILQHILVTYQLIAIEHWYVKNVNQTIIKPKNY